MDECGVRTLATICRLHNSHVPCGMLIVVVAFPKCWLRDVGSWVAIWIVFPVTSPVSSCTDRKHTNADPARLSTLAIGPSPAQCPVACIRVCGLDARMVVVCSLLTATIQVCLLTG